MKVTLFILIFLALAHQTFAANDVIVKNLKIYVNCTEFFIKSFSYIPTPIGRSIAASNVLFISITISNILTVPRRTLFMAYQCLWS